LWAENTWLQWKDKKRNNSAEIVLSVIASDKQQDVHGQRDNQSLGVI
jgi:hypothetical protein